MGSWFSKSIHALAVAHSSQHNSVIMQTQLANKPKNATLREWLLSDTAKNDLEAVAHGLMTGERLANVLYQCVQRVPALMECSPASLMGACKTLVLMGCEPDNIHGYLVPRNCKNGNGGWTKTCVPIPSARGLMRMARANGVSNMNIGCVFMGERFEWGMKAGSFTMSHSPNWDNAPSDFIGVYCTWTDKDGNLHGERMSKREIDYIMSRSDAAKRGNSPWQTDYEQMALKTVIKRAAKQWDLPIGIAHAMQDADVMEFGNDRQVMRNVTPQPEAIEAPTPQPEVAAIIDAQEAPATTEA